LFKQTFTELEQSCDWTHSFSFDIYLSILTKMHQKSVDLELKIEFM